MMSADQQSWILSSYYRDLEQAERRETATARGSQDAAQFLPTGYTPADFQGYSRSAAAGEAAGGGGIGDPYAAAVAQHHHQQQQLRASEAARASELRFSEFGGRDIGTGNGAETRVADGAEFIGPDDSGAHDLSRPQQTTTEAGGRFLHHNIIASERGGGGKMKRGRQQKSVGVIRPNVNRRQSDAECWAECQAIVDRLYKELNST
jgi:hypothetical protein